MQPAASVIICTHNPRPEFLSRTVEALQRQTLPSDAWEFLLVDNGSSPPVAEMAAGQEGLVAWHPRGRIVEEPELGLTQARLRGIAESTAELIVFVDDDNLLAPDYLEVAARIRREHPNLAAFGASILPEYEQEPPPWFHQFRQMVAVRKVSQDRWSNNPDDFSSTPLGAGMVITRDLAKHYAADARNNPSKRALGRRGKQLTGGEDIDIALTACDIGQGKGVFADLRLTHIIPAARTELSYLLRLQEATAFSIAVRRAMRNPSSYGGTNEPSRWRSVARKGLQSLRRLAMPRIERDMHDAWNKGMAAGQTYVRQQAAQRIAAGEQVRS
ncbi:MAG: glycosyltransferase family 2 protein [Planctomycetales bacterium]|nr:glycosyltransferase family 2 protein [Planctomycetales bacterium]